MLCAFNHSTSASQDSSLAVGVEVSRSLPLQGSGRTTHHPLPPLLRIRKEFFAFTLALPKFLVQEREGVLSDEPESRNVTSTGPPLNVG